MADPATEQPNTQPGRFAGALPAVRAGWRSLWQAPALIAAMTLLSAGVVLAVVTAPNPSVTPHLNQAESLIGDGAHRAAIALLNDEVYPWLDDRSVVGVDEARRYRVLIARAIAYGQQDLGVEHEKNYQSVIREYHQAEAMGATLGPRDLYALADAYVAVGQTDLAVQRADKIDSGSSELRDRITGLVVDDWLDSATPDYDSALDLLTERLTDPSLPTETRVWMLAKRAEVQLGLGFPEEAITRLVRALPRLEEADDESRAALAHQLGRGYLAIGALREAEAQFERVIDTGSPDQAALATVELAKVYTNRGQLVEARDLFATVAEREVGQPAYLPALLGLGETQSRLRDTPRSVEAYAVLTEALRESPDHATPTIAETTTSLLERYEEHMTLRQYPEALRYAGLASRLFSDFEARPQEVVMALAQAHAASANTLIGELGPEPVRALAALEPSTRAEAQRHLVRSAAHFRDFADRTLLTDVDASANALWRAGDLYDRAGDQPAAIEAFREYIESSPGSPRHAEARFRLGRAYQARGEFTMAAEWYEDLLDDAEDGRNEAAGFAVQSFVPLAQCYLFDTDPDNDADAEELLLSAVTGTTRRALTEQFHAALIELGSLYYRTGRHERAIERLTEAMQRDPQGIEPAGTEVLFRLADSHRLLADEIEVTLSEPMPDRERDELRSRVRTHRMEAMARFEQARDAIDAEIPINRTALDRLHLRNACFYLGDCAFDLGDYDLAIRRYDEARDRYPADPASLVALVQIVNAHIEQGEMSRARTANERAKRFYLSLPETAWEDPNLPMDREDWESWLDSSALLYEVAEGG